MLTLLSCGPLGWWRIRDSEIANTPAGDDLHNIYRLKTLEAAVRERRIVDVFALLRSAGVEPVLIKGWAAAQNYPEIGLRPWGDIDLCVDPSQRAAAEPLLGSAVGRRFGVDLVHVEVSDLKGLLARSRLVPLESGTVRVPCPEDHLRLLCIHALKHDVWRPLWLCDIAAAFERRPVDFDWSLLLGGSPRHVAWIGSTLALARDLLGLDVRGAPGGLVPDDLPRWLPRSVLGLWGDPGSYRKPREFFTAALWQPKSIPAAILERWPHPIGASLRLSAPLNAMPRLPIQIAVFVRQGARLLASGKLLALRP